MDFDKISRDFENDGRRKKAELAADRIKKYIGSGETAMDFGCGTGLIGMELRNEFSAITFIDSSQGMIDKVLEKIKDEPNAKAICCDLLEGSVLEQRFDFIYTSNTLHHIPDTAKVLSILSGLLNTGGKLIMIDMDRGEHSFHKAEFEGHNGIDRKELTATLEEIGFHKIEFETLMEGEKKLGDQSIRFSQFLAKAEKI